MADKKVWTDCFLAAGGYDIAGESNAFGYDPQQADVNVTNCKSSGNSEFELGLVEHAFSLEGFAQAAAEPHKTLREAGVFPVVASEANPSAPLVGDLAVVLEVIRASFTDEKKVGDVVKLAASGKGTGGWGQILAHRSGVTSSGDGGTGLNFGALTALQTLLLVLQVHEGDSGNLTVTVESDDADTFASATTIHSFTAVAAASVPAFQIARVAGPITDAYLRDTYNPSAGTWKYTLSAVAF